MKINYFPYNPGGNPYQTLFSGALERNSIIVNRVPPQKILPLNKVIRQTASLVQLDWPHDLYNGKNILTKILKTLMYYQGLRKLKKKPVVWTAHNLVAHNSKDSSREKKMIQKLIDICDGILLLSESSQKQLFETYAVNPNTIVKVIKHGHYIDVYDNNISKLQARSQLNISNPKVILNIGRIQAYKGTLNLIKKFKKLNDKNVTLLIAGTVSGVGLLNDINVEIDSCKSLGLDIRLENKFIPDSELQYYFNAADFVALPFENILNSGSAILAMSFGKVIIAPLIGAIPDVVPVFGLVGYEEGLGNLFAALEKAVSIKNIDANEQKIIEYTKENLDWDDVGKEVKELYVEILSRYKS